MRNGHKESARENVMLELLTSCESEESRNYYLLNQETLKYKYELTNLKKKKISIRNLSILWSYIKNGAFNRIKRRLRISMSKKEIPHEDYRIKKYDTFPSAKIVVYTCIWGKYDSIVEPMYINPNIDYYIITDQDIPSGSKWKKLDLPEINGFSNMSPIDINRFCKMLPHNLFPNYDYSIYVDGNIRIVTDMYPIIADMSGKVLGIHNYTVDCIYNMKDAIIAGRKAKKEDVQSQVERYRKEGFPEHFGAFECNILCRKHMDNECIEIMNNWWEEFNRTASKRDQLSLPYVIWKCGKSSDFIHSLGFDVRLNPRFRVEIEHIK